MQVCTADGAGLGECACDSADARVDADDLGALPPVDAFDSDAPDVVDAPASPRDTAQLPDVAPDAGAFVVDAGSPQDAAMAPRDAGCDAGRNDPNNCGGCGMVCPYSPNARSVCWDGVCATECNAGRADCDGALTLGCETNTATDPNNCGACGRVCGGQHVVYRCLSGACQFARCEPGWLDCDRSSTNGCEVDAQSSRNNCGACGVRCGASERCELGACVGCGSCPANNQCVAGACVPCREGTTLCGNSCIDTQTDRGHCGGCGVVCSALTNATVACVGGACTFVCTTGFADCNGVRVDGCERSVANDRSNCGACGRACGAGMACAGMTCQCQNSSDLVCDGQCIRGGGSPEHCGRCGNACSDREFCGLVNSPGGTVPGCISCGAEREGQVLRRCENRCVDLAGDNSNCGTCGNTCTGIRACFSGVCR